MRIKPSPEQIKSWIVRNIGNDYKIAKHGEEIRINNPLGHDDGYHLWINVHKACVHDFRPEYGSISNGSFIRFVSKCKKLSFKEAVYDVMGINIYCAKVQAGVGGMDIKAGTESKCGSVVLPDEFDVLDGDDPIKNAVKNYLFSRCVSAEKIERLSIGHSGYFVVFPYYENGKIVYWQSRSILNKIYRFPPSVSKTNYLYGIDEIDGRQPTVIVESIFNALMFDGAVAIGGSSISDKQIDKLYKRGVRSVIVAFDNDGAGVAGTAKCYKMMCNKFELFYAFPLDGVGDWNDVARNSGLDECKNMLYSNVKPLDFKAHVRLMARCAGV